VNKIRLWFVELYYIIFGMNKKYKLEEIGGMNGEVLLREMFFDNMDFVMMYFKVNDIRDDNGELVEKLEDDGWMECEGGVRDYVLNDGLILIEGDEGWW
tara:strand:- start:1166 stop:1462 length:297 start_codon:yes stop_codon:yes gene_type:complete